MRHLVLTCALAACAPAAPPRASVVPPVSRATSSPASAPVVHAPWPAASCAPGAAFARLRTSHSRRGARAWLIADLVPADPVRAAAVTADVLDELDADLDPETLHGELVGLALAERATAAATPPPCRTRLRARIDALHARACEVDSPRRFRTRTPACLELARVRCAIASADAEALSARGEHGAALAIFEALAFAPPPGCTSSRELGHRAAREAAAAGDPAHARILVQQTIDEHGYPVILRGSPFGHHRWRYRPPPRPTPTPTPVP